MIYNFGKVIQFTKNVYAKIFSVLFFTLFFIASVIYQKNVPPRGDEIHYLITAISIVQDKDLNVKNNYDNSDYQKYHRGYLDRHSVSVNNNTEYLIRLGLYPIILSILYPLFDRFGGILINLVLLSFLIYWTYLHFYKILRNHLEVIIVCIFLLASTPLSQYPYLLFPEIIGAFLISLSTKKIFNKKYDFYLALAIGLMPWIHIRFLILSLFLIFYLRHKSHFLVGLTIMSGFFIFNKLIYGSFNPAYSYALAKISVASGNILKNSINIFFDQTYGLFLNSPIYLLVIPGLYYWFKNNKKELLFVITVSFIYLIPVLKFSDWHGGYAPPARYLTPIIPILTPAIAYALNKTKKILSLILAVFLGTWGISSFLTNIQRSPQFGFIFTDGFSPFFNFLSIKFGHNLAQKFPSFYPKQEIDNFFYIYILLTVLFTYIWIKVVKLNSNKI